MIDMNRLEAEALAQWNEVWPGWTEVVYKKTKRKRRKIALFAR